MHRNIYSIALLFFTILLAAPIRAEPASFDTKALAMILKDFQPKNLVGLNRLQQDELQTSCTNDQQNISAQLKSKLEKKQLAAIRFPADGNFLGDWKLGEKIAQNGSGFTWSDKPNTPAGGGCYNCHRIGPNEISYGTIGPSLYQYGKLRGDSVEMQKYVFAKIYNAKAYFLCSEMPRFGYQEVLTEEQIKHLVALLLDPQSPVNQEAANKIP